MTFCMLPINEIRKVFINNVSKNSRKIYFITDFFCENFVFRRKYLKLQTYKNKDDNLRYIKIHRMYNNTIFTESAQQKDKNQFIMNLPS